MRCNSDGTNKITIFNETQPGGLSIDIENRFAMKINCMGLKVLIQCQFGVV